MTPRALPRCQKGSKKSDPQRGMNQPDLYLSKVPGGGGGMSPQGRSAKAIAKLPVSQTGRGKKTQAQFAGARRTWGRRVSGELDLKNHRDFKTKSKPQALTSMEEGGSLRFRESGQCLFMLFAIGCHGNSGYGGVPGA